MLQEQDLKTITIKQFDYADVAVIGNNSECGLVTATSNYIPIKEFKSIFNYIECNLVPNFGIQKLIFDKRELTIFHQPSMEWYFTVWKERVYDKGLYVHRKLLPNDPLFEESVKIGRESIERNYPHGKYKLMDIKYAQSIGEAINC